jgi:hypothetical protein
MTATLSVATKRKTRAESLGRYHPPTMSLVWLEAYEYIITVKADSINRGSSATRPKINASA